MGDSLGVDVVPDRRLALPNVRGKGLIFSKHQCFEEHFFGETMTKKQQKTDTDDNAHIDAEIDQYLAPLLDLHDDQAVQIARFLALKLSDLQHGIELVLANVAELRACVARNSSEADQS